MTSGWVVGLGLPWAGQASYLRVGDDIRGGLLPRRRKVLFDGRLGGTEPSVSGSSSRGQALSQTHHVTDYRTFISCHIGEGFQVKWLGSCTTSLPGPAYLPVRICKRQGQRRCRTETVRKKDVWHERAVARLAVAYVFRAPRDACR